MPEGNDMSKLLLRSIFIIFLAMGLAACGGGGTAGQDSSNAGDGDGSGDGDDGDDGAPDTIKMGVQIGHDFSEGSMQIANNDLTPSDSTTVTVYLVDENDDEITSGIDKVTFSSTCVEAIPPTATIDSPVDVSSGQATATYQTDGCTGTDTITARATYNGEPLTASGTVTIGDSDGDGETTIKMGVQIGHDFSEGSLQIADDELSSSDSTTVTVYLVDEDDFPITTGIDRVTFSSTCTEADPATATISSPVDVSSGIATATYTTDGCTDTDTITAQATFGGETLTASGEVTIVGENVYQLGKFTGDTFDEEQLDISVESLSAGGTASIAVYLVDADELPITDGSVQEIEFYSECSLESQSSITSPVPLVSGKATAIYSATGGCIDSDNITARAVTPSGAILARGTISVAAAEVGSIRFIDAEPATISLSGSGSGQATSVVTFELRNSAGGIMGDRMVRFSLDTTQGGLTLEPDTALSGSTTGLVSTTVTSGTVPTPVVVTATVIDTAISAESVGLAVESGPPDWDSFDVSTPILNPEVWGWSGYEQQITARLSDHFNNHVPDGTAVTFIPESGSVSGSCTTVDGACSVTWVSKNPVPSQNGRASILAYAIGEESFNDANGDGLFNMYDSDDDGIADTLETFNDKSELWWDWDEDGCRDTESVSVCTAGDAVMASLELETPIDFGGAANGAPNGRFDSPHPTDPNGSPVGDGIYNGALCDDTSCADAPKNINVGRLLPIVLSGRTPMWTYVDAPPVDGEGCVLLEGDTPVTLTFRITDERYQQMPANSSVSISSSGTGISSVTLQSYSSWPNTNEYPVRPFIVRLRGTADTTSSGTLSVTVTTPGLDQNLITADDNTTTTISDCISLVPAAP